LCRWHYRRLMKNPLSVFSLLRLMPDGLLDGLNPKELAGLVRVLGTAIQRQAERENTRTEQAEQNPQSTTRGVGGCALSAPDLSERSDSSARAPALNPSARNSSERSDSSARAPALIPSARNSSERSIRSAPDLRIKGMSAGARALKAEGEDKDSETFRGKAEDRALVVRRLVEAKFGWADHREQRVPHQKAEELAEMPRVGPMLVEYILERIKMERPAKPLGFLFAGLGATKKTQGRPWDVPITFSGPWAARAGRLAEAKAKMDAIQLAIRRGVLGQSDRITEATA